MDEPISLKYDQLVDSIVNSMIKTKTDVDQQISEIAMDIENLRDEWEKDYGGKDIFILYSRLRSYCNRKLFDISRDELKNISNILKKNNKEKIDPIEAASISLLIYILHSAIKIGKFKPQTVDFIIKQFELD